jgi:hypothetical protein
VVCTACTLIFSGKLEPNFSEALHTPDADSFRNEKSSELSSFIPLAIIPKIVDFQSAEPRSRTRR